MATFVSPGVYVQEFDFSSFVARQATTVIGIVGTAAKGPVNKPTLVTSADRFTDTFGRPLPTANNRGNFGPHAAVNALAETNQVFYVRVTDGTERVADTTTPIIINNQIVFAVEDMDGITVDGGRLACVMEVTVRPGAELNIDAYDALVRAFGAKNVFNGNFDQITSLADLLAELGIGSPTPSPAGSGVFVQVTIPLAQDDKTYANLENFVQRFNRVMLGRAFRADQFVIGTDKFISLKTQNLSDLVADNFEFKIFETAGGFATGALVSTGTENDIDLTARDPGVLGNGISVELVDVGNTFSGLPPVAVNARTIVVSINLGVTTAQEVVDALDANSASRLLLVVANTTGNDGSGTVEVLAPVTLSGGGHNLPTEFTPASASHLSTTRTQLFSATGLQLRFEAASPGEYANVAVILFGKDAFGLSTIEYNEENRISEEAVELTIQPAGSTNSFIDFMPGFRNLGDFGEDDFTLLSDAASLALALGSIDSLDGDVDEKIRLNWGAYEFYEAVPSAFAGGRSGTPDDPDELIGAVIGNAADETGIHAFQNRELFNNSILATPGFDQSAIVREALALSERTGQMLYIADTPGGINLDNGLTVPEVVDWHNGRGFGNTAAFNSSYGATYHSWQKAFDTFNGVDHFVPPSVLILEQIAFSDRVGEVWFAPAGFRRGRLARSQGPQEGGTNNQGDRDFMYSGGNAINPIVNFPTEGVVVFGQKTLQRNPSALDRINVRRMMIFLKVTVAAGVRIDLFEPNDSILLRQVRDKIAPVVQEVQNRRGINRFEVRLDNRTTSPQNRENSEVVGFILVEPTKAAEKIILNFVVTAQGASFTEALAAAGVA